jgi:hypothetical protein
MLARFVEMLFGCWHKNYSFPMTIKPNRRRGNASHRSTYVVCLDCGRELTYDWINMKVVPRTTTHFLPSQTKSKELVFHDLAS